MPINLTEAAKYLRKSMTDAERVLWQRLKAKQLDGLKFRRQEQKSFRGRVSKIRAWNLVTRPLYLLAIF